MARAAGALLAVAVLAAPLMFSAALPRLPALDAIPPSAAHRVLIWEFVLERIGERPLLGWGGESSRSLPGGRDTFTPEALERFGLGGAVSRAWFEGCGRSACRCTRTTPRCRSGWSWARWARCWRRGCCCGWAGMARRCTPPPPPGC
ncbi:hypothetical protein [Teichococcus aestuarii]|uniref:hypothetical protein n=1 Tax=Teichococcus aestuarii TaxID=568898 RepID=UPI00361067ED